MFEPKMFTNEKAETFISVASFAMQIAAVVATIITGAMRLDCFAYFAGGTALILATWLLIGIGALLCKWTKDEEIEKVESIERFWGLEQETEDD